MIYHYLIHALPEEIQKSSQTMKRDEKKKQIRVWQQRTADKAVLLKIAPPTINLLQT